MKILIWGRGVIGTQYAWALENAGHTVEFYVREGRKAQYGSYVNLELWDTRKSKKDRIVKEKWDIVMHEEIKENHDYDLIFISVNPEQISSVVKYLAPRVGNATVLFFSNFWQDPQLAVSPIPRNQIVYGFPGGGGGFEGNTLYGGFYKTVQFGTFESQPTKRDLEVRKLFVQAGFKIMVQKDIKSWPPKVVSFIMTQVVFSPKSMAYALMAHNHFKVGYAVQEIITAASKYGIKVPRLYEVENLIKEQ